MEDDELVDRFCEATGATRRLALVYLDLYGPVLEVTVDAYLSGAIAEMVDIFPPHEARSVSQSDIIIFSFGVITGELRKEVAIHYLAQFDWDLKRAMLKFKEDKGLRSKQDACCLNESIGSNLSWRSQAEQTGFNGLDEMIPLTLPHQIASSSQANVPSLLPTQQSQSTEELLHSFRSLANGVSREEAVSILDQFGWNVNIALTNFFNKGCPKKKSKPLAIMPLHMFDNETTPTASLRMMGLPEGTPQVISSSQEKAKLNGKADDQGTTLEMETSPASLVPSLLPTQSTEEVLHSFRILAHGVSREEAVCILDKFDWNLDIALTNFFDKGRPKKKSKLLHLFDNETRPTASIPMMGLPEAIPQVITSSQEKAKLKGKGKAVDVDPKAD